MSNSKQKKKKKKEEKITFTYPFMKMLRNISSSRISCLPRPMRTLQKGKGQISYFAEVNQSETKLNKLLKT